MHLQDSEKNVPLKLGKKKFFHTSHDGRKGHVWVWHLPFEVILAWLFSLLGMDSFIRFDSLMHLGLGKNLCLLEVVGIANNLPCWWCTILYYVRGVFLVGFRHIPKYYFNSSSMTG